MLRNAIECHKVLQSAMECYGALQSAMECYILLWSALKRYRVHKSVTEHLTLGSVTELYRALWRVTDHSRTLRSDVESYGEQEVREHSRRGIER